VAKLGKDDGLPHHKGGYGWLRWHLGLAYQRTLEWLRWAWNPPESRMIHSHEFAPAQWDLKRCAVIPGHPNGYCPSYRCQHNRCGELARYHSRSGRHGKREPDPGQARRPPAAP
jgi:hypothetical protein